MLPGSSTHPRFAGQPVHSNAGRPSIEHQYDLAAARLTVRIESHPAAISNALGLSNRHRNRHSPRESMHRRRQAELASLRVDADDGFRMARHCLCPGQLQRRGNGTSGDGYPRRRGFWPGRHRYGEDQSHDSHDQEQFDQCKPGGWFGARFHWNARSLIDSTALITCIMRAPMLPPMTSVKIGVNKPTIRSICRCRSLSRAAATCTSIEPSCPDSSPTATRRSEVAGRRPVPSNARCNGVPSGTRSIAFAYKIFRCRLVTNARDVCIADIRETPALSNVPSVRANPPASLTWISLPTTGNEHFNRSMPSIILKLCFALPQSATLVMLAKPSTNALLTQFSCRSANVFKMPGSGRPASVKIGEMLGTSTEMMRSEEHTSELQSPDHLVCRLLLEKKTL